MQVLDDVGPCTDPDVVVGREGVRCLHDLDEAGSAADELMEAVLGGPGAFAFVVQGEAPGHVAGHGTGAEAGGAGDGGSGAIGAYGAHQGGLLGAGAHPGLLKPVADLTGHGLGVGVGEGVIGAQKVGSSNAVAGAGAVMGCSWGAGFSGSGRRRGEPEW